MHGDASMSGTHPTSGPTGQSGRFAVGSADMSKSLLGGGECGNTTFTSKGVLISFCADFSHFGIYALQPIPNASGKDRFRVLAELALPTRQSTIEAKRTFPMDVSLIMGDTSGGAYFHLDKDDRVIIADAHNVLRIFTLERHGQHHTDDVHTNQTHQTKRPYYFHEVQRIPLGLNLGINNNTKRHHITHVMPDWHHATLYWFVTREGLVGTVDTAHTPARIHTHTLHHAGRDEEIQNAMAMDKDGVYIVSDHAMYRFGMDAQQQPRIIWREAYDRGNVRKPGQVNQGSGTTPTLMGDAQQYVAITDNSDPIHVVLYRRDTGQIVCRHPVFSYPVKSNDQSAQAAGLRYASATDNSLIGYGNSVIVENNYGYQGPLNNNWTTAGIARIDIKPKVERIPHAPESNCLTKWENTRIASPTTVPKLSVGNGLLYFYTRESVPANFVSGMRDGQQAWYLTTLDYHTGEVVYQARTGTGGKWNNNYAPITIGPDGTAYVGVLGGIISVRDLP